MAKPLYPAISTEVMAPHPDLRVPLAFTAREEHLRRALGLLGLATLLC